MMIQWCSMMIPDDPNDEPMMIPWYPWCPHLDNPWYSMIFHDIHDDPIMSMISHDSMMVPWWLHDDSLMILWWSSILYFYFMHCHFQSSDGNGKLVFICTETTTWSLVRFPSKRRFAFKHYRILKPLFTKTSCLNSKHCCHKQHCLWTCDHFPSFCH